jgi:hypothetical protein
MAEIVYVLTNEAMEGLVKIGRTTTSVEQRIRELDNTSVPLPFQCFYAGEVKDSAFVESRLHRLSLSQHLRLLTFLPPHSLRDDLIELIGVKCHSVSGLGL